MKKRLLAGVLVCLTVCLLAGTALGAGKVTGRAAATTTGTLGGLTWTLSGTTLTVSGTGGMPIFTPDAPAEGTNPEMEAWFANRSKARTVTISEGISNIGDYAFYGCASLTTLNLPVSLTTVGPHAFEGCTALTGALFSNGLTSIGDSAFSGCGNLSSVRIPSSVTSIGANAFNGSGLTSLLIPKSVTSIGTSAFDNCSKLSIIHYCGTYSSWSDRPAGGAGGKQVQVHYNLSISENQSHATCSDTEDSYYQLTGSCKECSFSFNQREPMVKTPHTPQAVAKKEATCEESGYEAGEQCSICKKIFSGLDPIPALGHDLGDAEEAEHKDNKEATCTESGKQAYIQKCKRTGCDYETKPVLKTLQPKGHSPKPAAGLEEKTTKEATCIEKGVKEISYNCTTCNQKVTITEEIPIDTSNHVNTKEVREEVTKATCEAKGQDKITTVCTDCQNTIGAPRLEDTDPTGHQMPKDPAEIEEEITKQPTCGEDGEIKRTFTCTICNNRVTDKPYPIPATGKHTPIVLEDDKQVDATCMKSGHTARVTCENCPTVLEESKNIPIDKDAHPEDKLKTATVTTKAPTCTEDGVETTTVHCENCGIDVSVTTKALPAQHTLSENPTPDEVKTERVDPTCTTPGSETPYQMCTICHKWIQTGDETVLPALGGEHAFGDWVILSEPQDGHPGLRKHTCTKTPCSYTETEPFYKQYTVTLNAGGGTLPDGTAATMTTGTDGKLSAALPEPTREGYIFAGWFTAADDSGREVGKDTVFTEDTEIHARWTAEQIFTITLNAGGGTLDGQETKTVTTNGYGKLDTLPTPAREGFTFDGWYTAAAGGSQITAATVFQENTTIYAHWTEKQGYTITLDADGGTLSGSASVSTGADGRLSALPGAPTREGYDFDGWFTAKEGGVAVTTGTTFGSDSTIYAHWSVIDNTTAFAIRIGNVTGGVISASASTATRGTKVTVLADPDSGYALDSVRVTASGTTVEVTRESEVKYSFTMPGKAVDVTASFKSTGSGSGSGSGSGNNNSSSNNSGGAVWDTGTTTADPNPQPVPVKQSVPQLSAYGPQTFLDIPTNHWAAGEIAWAFQQGYMNGTGGGSFSPQAPITHSQLWTVLTRLLRYSNLSESNLLAIRAGLLDGGNPNGPATRQELVTALHRCAYLLGGARTPSVSINTYGDSSQVAGYARDAMAWAVTNGIISGTADGRLNPNGAVSRAQFAVILYRFTCRM